MASKKEQKQMQTSIISTYMLFIYLIISFTF
jgi:hypothetical protein